MPQRCILLSQRVELAHETQGFSNKGRAIPHYRGVGLDACALKNTLKNSLYVLLQNSNLKMVYKNTFLLVITLVKRVGVLHALIQNSPCIHGWPDDSE